MAATDAELARLAGRMRVLRIEQLRAAGLSRSAIRHRVDHGRLQPLRPGVFIVGPDVAPPISLATARRRPTAARYM